MILRNAQCNDEENCTVFRQSGYYGGSVALNKCQTVCWEIVHSEANTKLTIQAMYVQRNIEARSCNRCYSGRVITITHYECVSVSACNLIYSFFWTEAIPLCNNNCTIYDIPSVHNNINIVI